MRHKRPKPRPGVRLRFIRGLLVLGVLAALGALLYSHVERLYMEYAYPVKYNEIVEREAELRRLPPSLVYAVIRTESSFRPEAESHLGARGLMQITGDTYDWIAWRMGKPGGDFDELYDAETNIRYGTALLRLLLDEFITVENSLCAYHAGWGRTKEWLGNPAFSPNGENVEHIPFRDTAWYVTKVLEAQQRYQALYDME